MLERVVSALSTSGWAAEIVDRRWIIRWQSPELLAIIGVENPREAGLGEHFAVARARPALDISPADSSARWWRTILPYMLYDDPEGTPEALKALPEEVSRRLRSLPEPAEPPPVWTADITVHNGAYTGHTRTLFQRVEGGTLLTWWPALPATVLAFLARGDRDYYRRIARLVTPGRHAAAVLFADLEGSTALSRAVTPEEYFARLTELTTAVDQVLVAAGAVVGKHAGDGATAFFVCEDFPEPADAARAAASAAAAMGPQVNVGLHWGDNLFMGQVVTDGRLEVTALGLPVNECARIQESAHGGAILASRAFCARLGEEERHPYTPLRDWPGASPKAIRDAGALEVTPLGEATRWRDSGP